MAIRGVSALIGLALGAPTVAFAGNFTKYSSLSSFEAAATGTVQSVDFSGLTLGPQSAVAVGNFFAFPEPFVPTTLQVSDTAYGGATYLDFSSPAGVGNLIYFAFGYFTASVSSFGVELGTLDSDGKRVDGELAYIHTDDPSIYDFTPFTFTPTGADVFIGFVGNPNVEIAGIILDQDSTRHAGTALDVLDVYATTPVPEPQAWTLMLLGFGLGGAVIRRRGVFATA